MTDKNILKRFSLADSDPPTATKEKFRAYYNAISKQLNESKLGNWAQFLNFGYAQTDATSYAVAEIPRHFPNRNSARLVMELVGDTAIDGKHILDVGCGRGGLLSLLSIVFAPAKLTGLDMSAESIAFASKTNTEELFEFLEGDAESLPFPPKQFDIVTNVESSHSYPDIGKFFSEVSRVLKNGGQFLYTDVLSVEDWGTVRDSLANAGFSLARDKDITANVILSCDQVAALRVKSFPAWNDSEGSSDFLQIRDFLGVSDSFVYQKMTEGTYQYRILSLGK